MTTIGAVCRSETCRNSEITVDVTDVELLIPDDFEERTKGIDECNQQQVDRLGSIGFLLYSCPEPNCGAQNVEALNLTLTLLVAASFEEEAMPDENLVLLPGPMLDLTADSVALGTQFSRVVFGK